MPEIKIRPISPGAFAPFGDVLDTAGAADKIINQGLCGRFHDRADLDFGPDGRAGVSLFLAEPRTLPYQLDLIERHPEGSQCFVPMHQNDWLAIVAEPGEGNNDAPGPIHAFRVPGGTAVNFHRGTWHGVLTPLHSPGLFAVIDRIGPGANLEEYPLQTPIMILD